MIREANERIMDETFIAKKQVQDLEAKLKRKKLRTKSLKANTSILNNRIWSLS